MAILQGINIYAIEATKFTFHNRAFIAEASDLTGHELFRQIYDDAADVGFAIRNPKTGNVMRFHLAEEHKDREGDTTHWTFHPIPADLRKHPCLADLKVVIFND